MTSSLLSIGKTGLLAAQVGISTTGHNITNANVAGYSRQVVQQNATAANYLGFGYVGSGTEVASVKRVYNDFLAAEARSAQTTSSALDTYQRQITQIDNLLADPTAGLSPALQDFFKGMQDLGANPASSSSRQAVLSGGDAMVARFQSLSARLGEIGDGVNASIVTNIDEINSYASQIAAINDSISRLSQGANVLPNDLLDKRDQMVADLNKYVKTTVVPGTANDLMISIGSGQPLVSGSQAFQLAATPSPTDPTRMLVGYQVGGMVSTLSDSSLGGGGSLGGLLAFRSETLDRVQNSLGRVATSMALAFNAQHKLGQDLNGDMGGDFFTIAPVSVSADVRNNSTSDTVVSAVAIDPNALTGNDYQVKYVDDLVLGPSFFVSKLPYDPNGTHTQITNTDPATPQMIDGVGYTITAADMVSPPVAALGDLFVVRPTVHGAAGIGMAVSDGAKIAAAAPLRVGAAPTSNTGDAKISAVSNDKEYVSADDPVAPGPVALPVKVTYSGGALTMEMGDPPAPVAVQVQVNGQDVGAPGDPIPYNAGDVITFGGVNGTGGISITMTGNPGEGDSFSIEQNDRGVGDNRNAVLLGKLQTDNIIGGSATFQGGYAQTVSYVGNKTREVQINGLASASLVAETTAAQEAVSGVNLDEEAANLLRYQQAYQACGKAMQVASQLFDVILAIR